MFEDLCKKPWRFICFYDTQKRRYLICKSFERHYTNICVFWFEYSQFKIEKIYIFYIVFIFCSKVILKIRETEKRAFYMKNFWRLSFISFRKEHTQTTRQAITDTCKFFKETSKYRKTVKNGRFSTREWSEKNNLSKKVFKKVLR